MKFVTPAGIGIGIVLLLLSVLWPLLFPATSSWTDEKAQRLGQLGKEAHVAGAKLAAAKRGSNMLGGESVVVLQEKFDNLMSEADTLREEFESADQAPKAASTLFKYAGIGVLALGIGLHFVTKDA
ncbi:MAG: hypothetical protein AAGA92_06775 [Planctomycetota bacterium]